MLYVFSDIPYPARKALLVSVNQFFNAYTQNTPLPYSILTNSCSNFSGNAIGLLPVAEPSNIQSKFRFSKLLLNRV